MNYSARTLLLCLHLNLVFSLYAQADPVDDYIKAQMQRQRIPGLSLAVVQAGRVVKAEGYGYANVELGVRATPETLYELASVTKQFTAAAIMLLVQDGKIHLDDKIGQYFSSPPPFWQEITLRHLLTHTAGLPHDGVPTDEKTFRADYSKLEVLQSAMSQKLLSPPGEKFAYSNLGFDLLGLVIEKVSGKPYGEFLRERIFQPLGMKTTRVNDLRTVTLRRASGYEWRRSELRNGEPISPTLFSASGSILSSVSDLAKWEAALNSESILTAASRQEMWTPMRLKNGKETGYGFGWVLSTVNGHPHIWHNGALSGFRTMFSRFPDEKLTVIVLTNQSGRSNPERIARGVAGLVDEALLPVKPPVAQVDAKTYPALTGRYEFANNFMLTLTLRKGRLFAQDPDNDPEEILPKAANEFFFTQAEGELKFARDALGNVTGLTFSVGSEKRKVPRIGPLVGDLKPQPDPDPKLTTKIKALMEAIGKGGKEVQDSDWMTSGARRDFAGGSPEVADLSSVAFVAEQNVAERNIERHGGKVARIRYYKIVTEKTTRYLLIHLTADNLFTDMDVIEE